MKTLILSDIHANLEALTTALDQAEYDQVWILGDLVGYGANPNEVIEVVRGLKPALIVRGNHDKACGGLSDLESFSDLAREAAIWTRGQLNPQSLDYLRQLRQGPLTDGEWAVSHGSPLDEDEYLISDEQVWRQMFKTPQKACFFGHTHVPILYRRSGRLRQAFYLNDSVEVHLDDQSRYFINPGSIGQPRDGDPRGCLALFDTESAHLRIIKFAYPIEKAARRILQAGLPEYLAQRLFLGT